MNKDELIARLLSTFLPELEEHVGELNKGLLALEKGVAARQKEKILSSLFRAAHSLKGAARAVDVAPVEALCHRLEEIFAAAREGRLRFDRELFQALFSSVDAIEDTGRRLREKIPFDEARFGELLPILDSLSGDAPGGGGKRSNGEGGAARHADPAVAADVPAASPEHDEVVRERATGDRARSFIRLPAERLDTLVAASGELLVARGRVEAQVGRIEEIEAYVGAWEKEWIRAQSRARLARRRQATAGTMEPPAALADAFRAPSSRARGGGDELRERLRFLGRELRALSAGFRAEMLNLMQTAGPLENAAEKLRMAPFAEACVGLQRAVRDLATAVGKEVEFVVSGGDLEIDRALLDGLKSPLLHLVRNAIDHGIEAPAERARAGKPVAGRIQVDASRRGARVRVVVRDDGRGLDIGAIRGKLRARGLPEPESDDDVAQLIFIPGLTTSALITEFSGRGVGLDVVKTEVESRRGTVEVRFQAGRETRFVLDLPLTLSRLRAVLVEAGGQTYALDTASIERLIRISATDIRSVEGRESVVVMGEAVPLVSLADMLAVGAREETARGLMFPAVVIAAGSSRAALAVDALVAEQEIVAKSLGPRLGRLPHVTGGTVLPTGRLALILNAASLAEAGHAGATGRFASLKGKAVEDKRKTVLVVDDSVTTRTLEATILEAAGYEVVNAADGAEAWQLLQEREIDLVVSDIEMPRVDGFALTESIRRSPRLRHLPVILVTARETEKDQARGLEVGADAYLLKSSFDQTRLLETISQLL